jgi:hypothetical protein
MLEDSLDLEVAEALWILGLLDLHLLPQVAAKALENGTDTPALRQLAGLTTSEVGDVEKLFSKTLRELDRQPLTPRDALSRYAVAISKDIVSGRQDPFSGARKIWKATLQVEDHTFHDFDPFIYACSEYAARPQDRAFFSTEIMKEAARVVERNEASK